MDSVVEIDSNHRVARFAPNEAALRRAVGEGYRSVVNVRTSDEKQDVTPADDRRVADEAGLTYLHHPVSPDALDDTLVDEFRRKLTDLPKPVLLPCASGKRVGAMTLMAFAADHGLDGEAAITKGGESGIDLSEEEFGQFVKDYADRRAGA